MPLQYSRKHYNGPEEDLDELREKIIGLGEESFRKSYYPELQEKLADLEEYKALLGQSNNAIFLIELPSGKFLDISESACKQLGYTARECYAMTLFDMAPGYTEDMKRIFFGEVETLVLEAMLRKGNGDFAPYEMSMRRVAFHNKDYLVVVASDITKRKRVEEALRESEERFRATFEQAAVGIAHVALDGKWIRFNQKLCDITGYNREELSKLTFQEITYPDDLEADLRNVKRLLDGEIQTYSREKRYIRKNGSLVWINLTVSLLYRYGNPEYFIAVIDDITERKRAEERLRLTQFAVDNLTDSSIWLDPEGRIIYVNKITCHDLGYTRDELLSMRIWDIDPYYSYERYLEKWKRLKKEGSIKFESVHVRKDGSSYPVEVSANYLKFEDKEYEVSFDLDITERKRKEKEMSDAKAQAELYLDLMGHDIRNYNQIAMGFLELAADILVKDKAEQELLSRPMDAINSSSRLIDNIIKLQRVTGGKAMKNRPMDLCDILDRIKTGYSNIPGRQITINYYPIPKCSIMANDLIYDIFTNLIGNAIKHTNPEKPLTIDIRVKEQTMEGKEYLKISIEDNGPGIPDELKEKLFTRLERGKTKVRGRGLGLYLVKTLAEHFGGRVQVEDRVAGDYHQGVRFIVSLRARIKEPQLIDR
jgi:PAS domain S-box-containing protein